MKLNASLEQEVDSLKTRLQHLEYASQRVIGSSGGSRQQLTDEIDQLECEIDEDKSQLDTDVTRKLKCCAFILQQCLFLA